MKIFKYLFAATVLSMAAVSCEVISEDAFSTAPVAPEMYAHSDILMTSNTMEEHVNFSWKPARFLGEGLTYDLYGKFGESAVKIASTAELFYKVPKTEFKAALYAAFPDLPQNDTFTMTFYVSVTNGSDTYQSDPVTIDIYAYGDAVSAELTPLVESIVLDVTDPTGVLDLLNWGPARLGYNEPITYDVLMKYGEGEYVSLAAGLTERQFSITVDELNEAAVGAGAPEAQEANLDFTVKAFSESFQTGVISNTATIAVTTYIATYPEFIYVPGGYQGWDPATAPRIKQSTVKKGYYEGMVDLSVEGGGNVGFKFSPNPAWEGDFAIDNIELTTFGDGYTALTGSGTTGGDISVPSGMYNIILNKKLNTLYMVQVETLSLIGAAPVASNGWANDVDMVYNPETKTFQATTEMQEGEFKIRVNHDWTHSAGGESNSNVSFGNGTNLVFDKTAGEYKVVLNVGVNPYTVTFINTSFPEKLHVPGGHQGWNPATAPVLNGDTEGHYEGFVNLTDIFKFTSAPDWDHTNYGGSFDVLDTDPGAGNLAVDAPGYYYLKVDLTTMSATATLIERVGVVGSFCGWGDPEDAAMTYNAELDRWEAQDLAFPAGTQYKFRMNGAWDINFGGDPQNLVQDGGNLEAAEAGMYDVTLSIATTPYHMTVVRTGDLETAYASEVVVAGDYSGHGWSTTDDPKLFGPGDGTYKGAITMYDPEFGFKIVESGNWISGQLIADTEFEFTLYTGDNMMLDNGTYFWNVNLPDQHATATPVTLVGLIGSFAGSDWGADLPMEFDEETLTYSVTVDLAAGNEFKIRFNSNWDLNLGGDITSLTHNGNNIVVQETGTYHIVLDMANTSSLTMTKQ